MRLFVACQVLHRGHPGRGRWIVADLSALPRLGPGGAARDRNGQNDASRATKEAKIELPRPKRPSFRAKRAKNRACRDRSGENEASRDRNDLNRASMDPNGQNGAARDRNGQKEASQEEMELLRGVGGRTAKSSGFRV